MGRKSREKRERRLAKSVIDSFAPEIEKRVRQEVYREAHASGFTDGLRAAAGCKTIAEVRKMYDQGVVGEADSR